MLVWTIGPDWLAGPSGVLMLNAPAVKCIPFRRGLDELAALAPHSTVYTTKRVR